MNIYGFDLTEAIAGLFTYYFAGIAFGVIYVGFLRFALLSVFERRET